MYTHIEFQYPLADRLGFWGNEINALIAEVRSFSILWRIDLVFGALFWRLGAILMRVSVSSGGSTWFLGLVLTMHIVHIYCVSVSSGGSTWFLGVQRAGAGLRARRRFSILWRIDLVFGASLLTTGSWSAARFQYPLADRLGFWGY